MFRRCGVFLFFILLDEIIHHVSTGHYRHVLHYMYSSCDIYMDVFNLNVYIFVFISGCAVMAT